MVPSQKRQKQLLVALACTVISNVPVSVVADDIQESPSMQIVEMAYEFHMGPLHVLSVEATLQLSEGSYELTSIGETRGITNLLFNMVNETESLGMRGEDGIEPTFYHQQSDSRWGEWNVEISYLDGSILELVTDPDPEDEGVTPVPPEEMINTIDPMAAFLIGARQAKPGDCTQTIDVFDGRRRYDLEFAAADPDAIAKASRRDLPKSQNFFWCQLKFKRVSGFEDEEAVDDEDPRERRVNDPVIMLLGHFPGSKITLPIYGRIKSDFGTARSRLTELTIDGVSMLDTIESAGLQEIDVATENDAPDG